MDMGRAWVISQSLSAFNVQRSGIQGAELRYARWHQWVGTQTLRWDCWDAETLHRAWEMQSQRGRLGLGSAGHFSIYTHTRVVHARQSARTLPGQIATALMEVYIVSAE